MLSAATDAGTIGHEMHSLAARLFPICRSITGNGLRETLRIISEFIPLEIHEVPTGTQVLDWTIPDEWNIRDAWIKNSRGERVVDFQKSNLHVVNYSVPVRARLSLSELQPRLFTLPDKPDWIPYRTTYYKRDWGFCLAHNELQRLTDTEYDVCIDSTLAPGSLTYGECFIPGSTSDEFLISCHCCHPSLANDNLSGISVAVALARTLADAGAGRAGCPQPAAGDDAPRRGEDTAPYQPKPLATGRRLRYSYRFLFIPGTIGAITWLARNRDRVQNVKHGLVLTCVGDTGAITYKKSRRGEAEIDRAVQHVLKQSGAPHRVIDFFPYGYDERQYCSPGFDLPVGCFMRSQHGTFPEYHTSADNLEFIKPEFLADSFEKVLQVVKLIEGGQLQDRSADILSASSHRTQRHADKMSALRYVNLKPHGEPQLSKYGLYEALDGDVLPALWVLNFSDSRNTLADIVARASLPFDKIAAAADILSSRGLLKEVEP